MIDIYNSEAMQSWVKYFFPDIKKWKILPPVELISAKGPTSMITWYTKLSIGSYLLYHEAQTTRRGYSDDSVVSHMVGYDLITMAPWYEFKRNKEGGEDVLLHYDQPLGSLFYQINECQLTIGHGSFDEKNDFTYIFQTGLRYLTEEAEKIGKVTFIDV